MPSKVTGKPPTQGWVVCHRHPQFTSSNPSSLSLHFGACRWNWSCQRSSSSQVLLFLLTKCPWCLWQCHKSAFLILFFNNIWISSPPWDLFCGFHLLTPFISVMLNLSVPSSKPRNSVDGLFPVSISAHHTCHILPQMKGLAYFSDVLKTHTWIFFPHFLFP